MKKPILTYIYHYLLISLILLCLKMIDGKEIILYEILIQAMIFLVILRVVQYSIDKIH